MLNPLRKELESIFSRVRILSAYSFSFNDESPIECPPPAAHAAAAPTWPIVSSDPLASQLQGVLYSRCYCRARNEQLTLGVPFPLAGDPAFVANLSAAISGAAGWDTGWQIYQIDANGYVHVQKGDRYHRAAPGEYVGAGGTGMTPQVGSTVSLQVPREAGYLQPGFYFAFGETLSDQFDEFSMVRLYFHVTLAGVCELLKTVTAHLNRQLVPFRIKCLNAPACYTRADGFVLYIARRHYRATAAMLTEASTLLEGTLLPEVPLFTKELRAGVGLAEEPGNGESFGMHRTRLLAEGIVDGWKQGAATTNDYFDSVSKRFQLNGLRIDAPHLNAGSVDRYDVRTSLEFAL
jgi:hypothetical protein